MRKMDYCRYDSPTYTGAYDTNKTGFVLNSPVEPGIYMIVMIDSENSDIYTFNLTVRAGLDSCADYMSRITDSIGRIQLIWDTRNEIIVDYAFSAGSTIELYKLN